MSKIAPMQTKCICGHELEFDMPKPTHFEYKVVKVDCVCGSRYLIKGILNRKIPGSIDVLPEILDLSPIARDIAKEEARKQGRLT